LLETTWRDTSGIKLSHTEASTDSLLVGSQALTSDTSSQINDNLANNTMTASNEASGSYQHNSAGVNDTNNMDGVM
jgi:hypothetical protein